MRTGMRLNEYLEVLQNKLDISNSDLQSKHIITPEEGLASPLGNTTSEEIRILTKYMENVNLMKITSAKPEQKKPLLLKKFFKMKRNQQVEVYYHNKHNVIKAIGKVSTVGRDFVTIVNLKDRLWLPYRFIESADIPIGVPTYDNSHQNIIYDNNLRHKLLTKFGETVSKREIYIQQFYEESLYTNLRYWKDVWVRVDTTFGSYLGKVSEIKAEKIYLKMFMEQFEIEMKTIQSVSTIRFITLLTLLGKRFLSYFSK